MNNKIKYDKEKLKKDLQIVLFSLEHRQNLQNLLVSTTKEAIHWLDWLIEDGNTAEEIKDSIALNSDFQRILFYLSDAKKQNEEQEKLIEKIIKKFKEQLE